MLESNQIEYEDISIQDAFEKIVNYCPDKIAIIEKNTTLTYSQFNRRVNQFYYYFKEQGINKGKRVVIIAERCTDSVVAILALIKLGAVYVPLDPDYPRERIDYVINDCEAFAVCCFDENTYSCKTIQLSKIDLSGENEENPENCAILEDPAYITYTSGTTGIPKGVIIPQKAIVKLKINAIYNLHFKEADIVAQFSTMASTASVSELFFTFLVGATFVITTKNNVLNVREYEDCCIKNKVNVLIVSPRYYMEINVPTVDRIITLGEAINTQILNKIPDYAEYINLYGTSETGGAALCWNWNKESKEYKKLPIGKTVKNVNAYIINDGKIVEEGQVGELCVVTDGLTCGYLNMDNLTNTKILKNPYGEGNIYHTGDRVKLQPDGNIVYVGRVDDQVKINGFRVELSDVDNSIKRDKEIKASAVIAKENDLGECEIYAYLVSDQKIDINEFRKRLLKRVPYYMVPAYIKQIDKIPLTQNGKLDRRNLPEIQPDFSGDNISFLNDTEKELYQYFEKVLNVRGFDCETGFFDLGGQSLKAIRLIAQVEKAFNCDMSVELLYKYPTVRQLAGYLNNSAHRGLKNYITKTSDKEFYDASSTQKRIYLLCQKDEASTFYNLPRCFICKGDIDVNKLKRVFDTIVDRHEILRTSFLMKEGKVVQKINYNVKSNFVYFEDNKKTLDEVINGFVSPFSFTDESLVRMQVVKSAAEYIVLMDMHHIINDGTGYNSFINELNMLYANCTLESVDIQYKDYSEWMNHRDLRQQAQYWINELGDANQVLDMPLDYTRPKNRSFKGKTITKDDFSLEFHEKIRRFSIRNGLTDYMVYLAAMMILLSKYSRQDDVLVGTPFAARMNRETENMIGMFSNTLVMRGMPNRDKKIITFLNEIKEKCIKAQSNQEYPFDELVEELGFNYSASNNPLFDVMLVLENQDLLKLKMPSTEIKEFVIKPNTSKFDLTIFVYDQSDYSIGFEYCEELFDEDSITNMMNHYVGILDSIVTCDIEQQINTISLSIDNQEKKKLLEDFNDTTMPYQMDKTIVDLFEEQVIKTPDKVAVECESMKLTYSELNQRANEIAVKLREIGVKPNDFVAILAEKSLEMIIAIYGVMKSGAAYIPIDTSYPEERIRYILEDSQPKTLLVYKSDINSVPDNIRVINLENENEWRNVYIDGKEHTIDNVEHVNKPTDLIYCIYTSGTTGKPKGVLIEHRSLNNYLLTVSDRFFDVKGDIPLFTNYAFDLTVTSIWGSILFGKKLVVFKNDIDLLRYATMNDIAVMKVVPTHLMLLLEESRRIGTPRIRRIMLGGEAVTDKILNEIYDVIGDNVDVINEYGPTEGTVACSFAFLNGNERITIGTPFYNSQLYVMDQEQLCGIGIPGELCIAGDGVARGYLNREELTAEKFKNNPFGKGKIYHTGDLARWLPNGNIEYLGRIDEQIKIRGFRVELGEIESQIRNIKGIKDDVVIAKADNSGNNEIYAYYVVEKGHKVSVTNVREALSVNLPNYMIPAYMMQIESIPVTKNGKIDKKNLPDITVKTENEYVAPNNEIEEKICGIFGEILGVERVGIKDNFFELGGHSLRATRLINRIEEQTGHRITLKNVFSNPTPEKLALIAGSDLDEGYVPIPKAEEKECYFMSSAQKRTYLITQMDPDGVLYNMPQSLKLRGEVRPDALKNALQKLIDRHEILRTSFVIVEGNTMQKILPYVEANFEYFKDERTTEEELVNNFIRPFDLSNPPLVRVRLIDRGDHHLLSIDMHHIIGDGMSMGTFIRELCALYNGEKLKPLTHQYKDYSEWMRGRDLSGQAEYWKSQFEDEIPVLDMPLDYSRPQEQSFNGALLGKEISKKLTKKIKKIASENGTTDFMVLMSAAMILFSKYSRQEDIVIGTPISGRTHRDTEGMLGMFVNTLAMRGKPEARKTYKEFLMEVKDSCLKAYENQEYPFEELVEVVDVTRDMSRSPLFDVMLVLQNNEVESFNIGDTDIEEVETKDRVAKFDLTINIGESNGSYGIGLEYCTDLFREESAKGLLDHFVTLLNILVSDVQKKIGEIEIVSGEEKAVILNEFNSTKVLYPRDKTVVDLFENQVKKSPDSIAVVYEDSHITYRELNTKANALAHKLRELGVGADDFVAIICDRSIEMIEGVFGILKAGGAYVPIDPTYPDDRIKFMLDDMNPKAVLKYTLESIPNDIRVPVIDLSNNEIWEGNKNNPEKINNAYDHVYCIYTSGTTGVPKGAAVYHTSFTNLVTWYQTKFDFNDTDVNLFIASICFDLAQKNIFTTLITGGKLVVCDITKDDNDKINNIIESNSVTVINCAPSVFNYLIKEDIDNQYRRFASVKSVFLGGEPINAIALRDAIESENTRFRVINTYGPTECTDVVSSYSDVNERIIDGGIIPIGKANNNNNIFVLDGDNLCGIGVPGELCISGIGVSGGYINRQELTDERFVNNPFGKGKMYRTGDLARWLHDGNLEYLGRIDEQVKIRGLRIELGEIESRIREIKYVRDAAVIAKDDVSGDKAIYAYFVLENGQEISITDIREYLSTKLPDYMIPSYMMQIDAIPITKNGKLDKRALPDIKVKTEKEYVAPRNETEEKICEIFNEILGVGNVGVKDGFFELGGHSLKVTRLVNLIENNMGIRLPLKEIFRHSTPEEVASLLENANCKCDTSLPKADIKKCYEMSSTQKRTYLSYKIDSDNTSYNSPYCFVLNGEVNVNKIKEVIQKLIDRHEILRTSFSVLDDKLVQIVLENVCVDFSVENNDLATEEDALQEFIHGFDLAKPPLFRVKIIKRANDYLMLWDIHHIVSDGFSMSILINEFNALFKGQKLPELTRQFKDYSEWMNSRSILNQKNYWLDVFEDEIPVLNLPLDYSRTQKPSFKGNLFSVTINTDLYEGIKKFAQDNNVTEYMFFLASFMVLLSKYSRQDDLVIGSPISARTHKDTENMLGMFVNTLALRGKPKKDKTFIQFLKEIKDICIKAYDNQEYPFEELVEALDIQRDISRNPLFDIMLTMQNIETPELQMEGVACTAKMPENTTSKFDVSLDITEENNKYNLVIEFAEELFKLSTIELMMEHYKTLLENIINNPNDQIEVIELISDQEKKMILEDFNNTFVEFDHEKFIMDFFEEQVEKSPDKVAVVYDTDSITYRELNNTVNIVARELIDNGVEPDVFVALLMERSIEMVIGMLAILKAGGAYVPMDIRYPEDRIQYMINDCKPKLILTNKDSGIEFKDYLVLDLNDCRKWKGNTQNIPRRCQMNNLAYCIYTSGTTGKPKGTLIEHKGFYNLMLAYTDIYKLTENDVVLQVANYVFDQSVWDIFNILIMGGKLTLISFYDVRNPKEIANVCNRNKVTIASFTPAMLAELNPDDFETIRVVDSSGEAANVEVLNRWFKKCKVVNTYGPTEVTVNSSSFVFDGNTRRAVPIGKPIANYQMYILDKNELCGIGIVGELCIAGIGVARGYLNAEELTQNRFVDNPFGEGKMYRTGDLARWLPDGNVEFLGRMDEQVKIRGFRIEIGDIDSTIRKIDGIDDCVVTVSENKRGDKVLCSYVVSKKDISVADIKYQLKKELPDYMIPSFIYQIDRIPFNASGKVDRKSLPKPEIDIQSNYVEPRNDIERNVCRAFSEVLDIKQVGIEDDFFNIGGHSLLAIRLIIELEKMGYEFALKDIFKFSRVCDIARYISGKSIDNEGVSKLNVCTDEDIKLIPLCIANEKSLWEEDRVYVDVEPYNDLFYISCFYNALFSAVRKFDVNPLDIMVQAIPSYKLDVNTGLLREDFVECKSWRSVLDENNVTVDNINQCDDVVGTIKTALKNKCLVIVQIDGYYSPIRDDLYGKIHWSHNILVHGFDETAGEFDIIEHSDRFQLDYKKKRITYYDLEKAYEEGVKRFPIISSEPSVVILKGEIKDNPRVNVEDTDGYNKRTLISNINKSYAILDQNILLVKDNIIKQLCLADNVADKQTILIDNINRIIESKKVLHKLITKVVKDIDLDKASSKLVDLWEITRAKVVRAFYSSKSNQINKNTFHEEIEQIVNAEKSCLNLLYHWDMQLKIGIENKRKGKMSFVEDIREEYEK